MQTPLEWSTSDLEDTCSMMADLSRQSLTLNISRAVGMRECGHVVGFELLEMEVINLRNKIGLHGKTAS